MANNFAKLASKSIEVEGANGKPVEFKGRGLQFVAFRQAIAEMSKKLTDITNAKKLVAAVNELDDGYVAWNPGRVASYAAGVQRRQQAVKNGEVDQGSWLVCTVPEGEELIGKAVASIKRKAT